MGATGKQHTAALLSLIALGLLVTPQHAGAGEGGQDIDASGSTFASGIDGYLNTRPGLLIIPDVVHAAAPYTITEYSTTSGASARAASYFPGQGPLSAPVLVCAATPVCGTVAPPDYPLIADANYPARPDSQATASGEPQTVGPLTTTPSAVTAHAGVTDSRAEVLASGTSLAGIAAEAIRSTSRQVVDKGRLVLRSEVVLSGVTLPGALHIDQVRSEVLVDVLLDRVSSGSARTTVSGATVAGIPVTVSATGISVNGQGDGGAVGAAAQGALAQLAATGLKARVLPPTSTLAKGRGAASTGGLLVSFQRELAGVPPLPAGPSPNRTYVGSFTLGAAGVSGFAAPVATFLDAGDGLVAGAPGPTVLAPVVTGLSGPPRGPTNGTAADQPFPPTEPGAPTVADVPRVPSPVTTGTGTGTGTAAFTAARSSVLPEGNLHLFALALLLYPLFLVVGAFRRSPSRLPRVF